MAFNIKKKITDFHYGKKSALLTALFILPTVFYFLFINIKNFLYKINFLKETVVEPFIICVGNLTTGGVGKTPVVIELANFLAEKNLKVAILSRGYQGKLDNKKVNLIKNFDEILIDDPILSGDEVNLISKETKNVVVVTSSNRIKAAKYLKENFNIQVIIMDDGFSNRKIKKNLSLLLIDSKSAFGNGFCLPMGPLREPLSEIKRADKIIVVQKGGSGEINPYITKNIKDFEICKMIKGEIYNIKTGEILDKKEVLAFSGIGAPDKFYSILNDLEIKKTISFDDHFEYNQKTVDMINEKLKSLNLKAAVTTEKDMVKILKFQNVDNFYALKLKPLINFNKILDNVNLFN